MDLKFLLNIGIFESKVQFLDHASSWTLNSLNVLFNLKTQSYKIVGLVMMCLFSLLMLQPPQNVSVKRWLNFNTTVEVDRNGQWGLMENLPQS